ncbi:MAG: type IV secretion protein IcmL [Gammaproteobacteria bacterium]|jgi:hypothetical protein|nr:type IV secretion protein IcmL [Gammaproteobacteria bacterium]
MNYASQKHSSIFIWRYISGLLFWIVCAIGHATPSETDLSVWVNEAIVTTYTFSADNFLDRQKAIAKYFTSQGWINFTKAIQAAKLQESVEKSHYVVSAVALLPPTIKFLSATNEWEAKMPLLVLYKGPEYQQKQTLEVVITFISAKGNEGVRGLVLTSFTTTVTKPACRCERGLKTKVVV